MGKRKWKRKKGFWGMKGKVRLQQAFIFGFPVLLQGKTKRKQQT